MENTQSKLLLEILDDLGLSIRMSDFHRAALIGFVWEQRRTYLLSGVETWADQNIRSAILGGRHD